MNTDRRLFIPIDFCYACNEVQLPGSDFDSGFIEGKAQTDAGSLLDGPEAMERCL